MKNFTRLAILSVVLNATTAIGAEKCILKDQEEMSDGSYLCEYQCPSGDEVSEYSEGSCVKSIVSDGDLGD